MSLEAPWCHWTRCSRFGKPMDLINEGDQFWFFACGCGCTRAVSKPAVQAEAARTAAQRDIERIKAAQRLRESRPGYSIPKLTPGGIITHG